MVFHNDYLKTLLLLEDDFLRYNKLLESKKDFIISKISFEINTWVNNVFFIDETQQINLNINNTKNYINETYINDIVNKRKVELDSLFFSEWSKALKEVSDEIEDDIKKYINNITYKSELVENEGFSIEKEASSFNDLLAVVGTGAVLGATSASVVSIYSALIGSSAASTTMSSALMIYCPPLLIAGTVSGFVGKIIYDKVVEDKKRKDLLNDIDTFIENIRYKIINNLNETYINYSLEITNTTLEILKNIKGVQASKYELENFIKDTKNYIDELKAYIK